MISYRVVQQVGFVRLQLYREGKLYSFYFTCYAPSSIMFTFWHRIKACIVLRVVTGNEDILVEDITEEPSYPIEVGFDICGTDPEPEDPVNEGKPRIHLNLP